jgi:hypothetical protein
VTEAAPPGAWPAPSLARIAANVAALAARVAEPDVRSQLHALAALVENLGGEARDGERRRALEQQLAAALAADDERRALATLRELTALDRAAVHPVDWSAASGG